MKYIFSFIIFALLSLSTSSAVFGATSPVVADSEDSPVRSANAITIDNPIIADDVQELFQTIIDIVLVFAIPIIVFFIIYAGFLYVTARGNESTIQQAHMALLYALVGGLLILGARVLIEVVQGTVDSVR